MRVDHHEGVCGHPRPHGQVEKFSSRRQPSDSVLFPVSPEGHVDRAKLFPQKDRLNSREHESDRRCAHVLAVVRILLLHTELQAIAHGTAVDLACGRLHRDDQQGPSQPGVSPAPITYEPIL